MKVSNVKCAAVLLAGMAFTRGALAEPALAEPAMVPFATAQEQLAAAFEMPPEAGVNTLSSVQMTETEGQLWPLIGAVVSVDLALSAYFWGVYVPTVYGSSSGFCVTCYAP